MLQPPCGQYTLTSFALAGRATLGLAALALSLGSCANGGPETPEKPGLPGHTAGSHAADGGSDASGSEPAADSGADGGHAGSTRPDSGTDEDSGMDGEANPVDVEKLARGLADAMCASLRECVGAQKLAALTAREDCNQRLAKTFAQADFAGLPGSIESGAVEFDEAALDGCFRDARALGCDAQTERLPPSCERALAGQRAEGELCTLGVDCIPGTFCPSTAECPRTCESTRPAGERCARDEECRRGLICVAGQCSAPVVAGAACAGESGAICALGLSCVGSTDTEAGTCEHNREIQVGGPGEVCSPGGTLCKEGLSCAYDSPSTFKCRAAAKRGATCRLALPGQCPLDSYCNAPEVTADGECVALPVDGEGCVLGDDCAPGHVCTVKDDSAICRRLSDLGEGCLADGLCRSGLCLDGQCATRPVCE